jgi:hypothetical protein
LPNNKGFKCTGLAVGAAMQKRKIRNMPWQEGFPQSITAQSAANPSNVPSPWASACERQKALGEKVTVQISDGPALLPWSSPANTNPSLSAIQKSRSAPGH